MVGPQNVVHGVTNNGVNFKAIRKKITKKYSDIYWSSCTAQCINLIMKDIVETQIVKSLTVLASKIT